MNHSRAVGLLFIALLYVLGINACNESKDISLDDLGSDYYPLEIGRYSIYDVEEIRYLIAGFDTSTYQLREIIIDTLQNQNQTIYILRREIRTNASQRWESDSLWTVTKTNTYLSITENSIPFIKLTFPVNTSREWDGNSLNARSSLIYYYQPLTEALLDTIASEDHVRVIIEDIEENITGVDLRSEVYAKGIGLVQKDYLTQERCTASDCGSDLGEVIGGRSLKQTLIEIGYEE